MAIGSEYGVICLNTCITSNSYLTRYDTPIFITYYVIIHNNAQ